MSSPTSPRLFLFNATGLLGVCQHVVCPPHLSTRQEIETLDQVRRADLGSWKVAPQAHKDGITALVHVDGSIVWLMILTTGQMKGQYSQSDAGADWHLKQDLDVSSSWDCLLH